MSEFRRERRYLVFKISDMNKYLPPRERKILEGYSVELDLAREDDGKPPLECLVIESDWPEYERAWRTIEARVTGAEQPSSHALDDSATTKEICK